MLQIGFCVADLYGHAGGVTAKKRRFSAPRAAARLVHYLLFQKVISPRFGILNGGPRPRAVPNVRLAQVGAPGACQPEGS
jgi:hypothetical protein